MILSIFPTDLINDDARTLELAKHAILAPHNATVDRINADVLRRVQDDSQLYEAINTPTVDDPMNVPLLGPEAFQTITPSGFPAHKLELKVVAVSSC
ncbi:hypothetical protein L596_013334 [Steinernema carpocapsae]|uniref:Uncharacterized protein n=1 Tax=Steinernema carpocapsae TaxID=34508 RepID=A0A4U5P0P9_STECR|nr:hypothetical protein L596_013334 [Steinernema carpocapsae]